jgi:hypothetical protein
VKPVDDGFSFVAEGNKKSGRRFRSRVDVLLTLRWVNRYVHTYVGAYMIRTSRVHNVSISDTSSGDLQFVRLSFCQRTIRIELNRIESATFNWKS